MSTRQFSIILPSNSSMTMYPDNKTSNFKVKLPNPIELDISEWEVGLSEIQFPHLWYNIRVGKNEIIKEFYNLSEKDFKAFFPNSIEIKKENGLYSFKEHITVPEGYYEDVRHIISQVKIQEKNISMVEPMIYNYNPISKRTAVIPPRDCRLHLKDSDIAYALGFNPNTIISLPVISDYISTTRKYNALYLYTDIVQNQTTGDIKTPLLRVIPNQSKHGDIVCIKYDKPNFIPLSRSHIETIEINIRDDTGQFISFESGKAVVTLIFRKSTPKFYM